MLEQLENGGCELRRRRRNSSPERQSTSHTFSFFTPLHQVEIAQIADHRQIKLVRDYALLRDRIANAGEQQKKGTKQGQRNRNRSAPNRAAQAKKDLASGKISQSDAVLSIIADGAK